VKTIVVGYDGSETAERALGRAADVAQAFSGHLVVISVAESPPVAPFVGIEPPSPMYAGPAAAPIPPAVPPASEASADPAEQARRLLDRARASLAGRTVGADYVAEVGDPAERLLEVAERHEADLIVLGSHEHGFLDRLLGGGVEEAVARRAHRDVLLVH
jgi:nucleotide-binding universal stress UspA family protein